MPSRRVLALVPALFAAVSVMQAADAAAVSSATPDGLARVAEEKLQVEDRQVLVTASKDITRNPRGADEADVASRELFYRAFDGSKWGEWKKHPLAYPKEQAVTWAPAEGHWQIYFFKTLTSGITSALPSDKAKFTSANEFVIDRTVPTGTISFPPANYKLRGNAKYTIQWNASDRYLKTSPITLQYSRDGKGDWTTLASDIPNTGSYEWSVPGDQTPGGHLRLLIADKAGNVGMSITPGLVVDSVPPAGRIMYQEFSNVRELTLTADVKDSGPAGLASAKLWVSQDEGATWSESSAISEPFTSVAWKATTDGRYRFAVVASDQAGNASAIPKGKDDKDGSQRLVIVDTTKPQITLSSSIGIAEADKTSSGRRAFKPNDRVAVSFDIKDANIKADSVTVSLQTDPAKGWVVIGKDQPTNAAFAFNIPNQGTKAGKIKVTAVDRAGNIGEIESSEVFEIQTAVAEDDIEIK